MANCTECGLEMVKSDTKKKGMSVYKHKDPDAAKAKGCGVSFIPVRSKADASSQAPSGPSAKNYAEAVSKSKRSGKQRTQQQPAQPASNLAGPEQSEPKRSGFLESVTEFVLGK